MQPIPVLPITAGVWVALAMLKSGLVGELVTAVLDRADWLKAPGGPACNEGADSSRFHAGHRGQLAHR